MTLEQALKLIADAFNFDADGLYQYAILDTLGGYHTDPNQETFPCGSIWGVEGQALYALTRAIKPLFTVEIGTNAGCSAAHVALAHRDNDIGGQHICLDPWEGAGSRIPDDLRPYIELIFADGVRWVEAELTPGTAGLIFEDGPHDSDTVRRVWQAASEKLAPGGVVISHDAMHATAGLHVRTGVLQSGLQNARFYGIEPSDCGLAVYRTPQAEKKVVDIQVVQKVEPPAKKSRKKTG